MDKVFAAFESESDTDAFSIYLNTRHENIEILLKKRKITNFSF